VSATAPEATPERPLSPRRRGLAVDVAVIVGVLLVIAALLIATWYARTGVVWLIASAFFAFSIDPLVQFLRRRLNLGLGKSISLAFGIIAAGTLVITFIVFPPIIRGARELKAQIPEYVGQLQGSDAAGSLNAEETIGSIGNAFSDVANFFGRAGDLLSAIGAIASGAFALFMILTFTIYLLVYGRGMRQGLAARMSPLAGEHFRGATRALYDMNRGYWYGKFVIALIAGTTCWVGMFALDLPYAAPLSFFVAITDLIPQIGATLGTIPVAIVGLLEEPWKGVVITVWLLIYQQFENNVLTPKIFKKAIDVHPFVTVVAVTVGGMIFGLIGTLLALPIVKGAQIIVEAVRTYRAEARQVPGSEPAPGG
jgi:predicted PurR-regulated permease PerM